jgi:hypothetical protein
LRPYSMEMILPCLVYLPDHLPILHRKYSRQSDISSRQHRQRDVRSRHHRYRDIPSRQRHIPCRCRQYRYQRSDVGKQCRQWRRTSSKIARMTAGHGCWFEEISALRSCECYSFETNFKEDAYSSSWRRASTGGFHVAAV